MSLLSFFPESKSQAQQTPTPLLPQCGACGLYKKCKSPKMGVNGEGRRKILIVGEAPGANEDDQGVPFIGRAGKYLSEKLRKFDCDLRQDCWITNALICRPPDNKIDDPRAVEYCRPNLLRTLRELQPEVIFLLGSTAMESLLGHLWKEDFKPEFRWRGQRIPNQRLNAWICPTWHPSYLLRSQVGTDNEVVELLFEKHIRQGLELEGRPFDTVPDYRSQVEVILDGEQAVQRIQRFQQSKRPVAVDYETNMLKPDGAKARIVTCALSNGKDTISYPWHGKAKQATIDFLRSPVPKVAANAKFELRWTRAILKTRIRNIVWDTMLAAHVLDNRAEVSGLKFQAFAHLGQESYDEHIKPYLKGKEGGNSPNRIRDIPLHDLLLYGGLDALLEWHLAQKQSRQLGVPLA